MQRIPSIIVVIVGMSVLLSGCSSVNSWLAPAIADHLPPWAGGLPEAAPPRPGTKEYEENSKKEKAQSIQTEPQREQPAQ